MWKCEKCEKMWKMWKKFQIKCEEWRAVKFCENILN